MRTGVRSAEDVLLKTQRSNLKLLTETSRRSHCVANQPLSVAALMRFRHTPGRSC